MGELGLEGFFHIFQARLASRRRFKGREVSGKGFGDTFLGIDNANEGREIHRLAKATNLGYLIFSQLVDPLHIQFQGYSVS